LIKYRGRVSELLIIVIAGIVATFDSWRRRPLSLVPWCRLLQVFRLILYTFSMDRRLTGANDSMFRIVHKLVARGMPLLVFMAFAAHAQTAQFVGSTKCKRCHEQVFDRWSKTRMANIVLDPAKHPDVIIPDLTKPDPLVKFTRKDIAFVYGSKWKQRYFTKVGDDFFPLGAQWDVTHKVWRSYMVQPGTDWWVPFYPADNMKRPTGPTCDGCHSVNYDIRTKEVTEWNVGCEKCHGPGGEHVDRPSPSNIVNPARLDFVHASDVCIQCHSQGRPLKNPIEGKYFDWPVGFVVGQNLSDYWPWRTTLSASSRSLISPTAQLIRTGCKATTSCKARCTPTASPASVAMTSMAPRTTRTC